MRCLYALLLCFIQLASALQLVLPSLLRGLLSDTLFATAEKNPPSRPCLKKEETGIWLSSQWTVLGPFPAGMREHQMGAFPALMTHSLPELFALSDPVKVSSTYGKGGYVSAKRILSKVRTGGSSRCSSRAWHSVQVSYPEIDWKAIQQSVGWSGIQWQALSVTDLHIGGKSTAILSMTLASAAEFAVLTENEYHDHDWENSGTHIKWYNGDWYAYTKEDLVQASELPGHTLRLDPGKYKVFVKGIYEVRIFGGMKEDIEPMIEYDLDVRIREGKDEEKLCAITTGQFLAVPDIVDGNIAGWGISFGLRSYYHDPIEIVRVGVVGEAGKYITSQSNDLPSLLAPLQVRPFKLGLTSLKPLPNNITTLKFEVTFKSMSETRQIALKLPLRHVEMFSSSKGGTKAISYQYTYLDSDQTVQYAIATPPRNFLADKSGEKCPAVLHLHGAGVDVRLDEARNNLLTQNHSWIIQPSGRSLWGYDWQTASHLSARTALQRFSHHMYGLSAEMKAKAASIDPSKVMVTGHSNGGQGANHYANHRPDEIIGAVIAAGYISLADYVPMTWQLGRHFNDAALNGILRSSLNAFENDLFASNLAGLPLLIKYGEEDDNVPPWHSRELASLIQSWNHQGHASKDLVKISEVPNKSHWWPEVMKERDVQEAIDARLDLSMNPGNQMPTPLDRFTLTVFNPEDSGSKQGWKILQVEVPGRMARLEVEYRDEGQKIKVRSAHVLELQVDLSQAGRSVAPTHVEIDGTAIAIGKASSIKRLVLTKTSQGWSDAGIAARIVRPMGPMIRFLSSPGPVYAIVPTNCDEDVTDHYMSIALRFSTDAYLYGRLDTVILYDHQAFSLEWSPRLASSNVVLLGGATINTVSRLASTSQTLVRFLNDSLQFSIEDRIFSEGSTLLTLFPHPFVDTTREASDEDNGPQPMTLLLHGTDSLAIERGYSLLPVRTGTLLPEWIVVDKSSVWKVYGGVVGAGWYDHDWSWSEAMSYLS